MENVFQVLVQMVLMAAKPAEPDKSVSNVPNLIWKFHSKQCVSQELHASKEKKIVLNVIFLVLYVSNVMIKQISTSEDPHAFQNNVLLIKMGAQHAQLQYLFAKFVIILIKFPSNQPVLIKY